MLCIIFKSRIEKNPHLLSLSFSRFLKFVCITISSRIQKLLQRNRCSSRFSHFGLVMKCLEDKLTVPAYKEDETRGEDTARVKAEDKRKKQRFMVWCELVQCLDKASINFIHLHKPDGVEAWKAIVGKHRSNERPRIQTLLTQLAGLKMAPGEKVTDYLSRAEGIQLDLQEAGEMTSNAMFSAMVLKGLPPTFESIATVLNFEPRKGYEDMKQDIINFANTRAEPGTDVASTAFHSSGGNSSRKITCFKCQKEGHIARDCRSKESRACFKCNAKGHLARDCKSKKGQSSSTSRGPEKQGFFSFGSFGGASVEGGLELLVDSGCNGFMLKDRDFFKELDEAFNTDVGNANGSRTRVEGRCTARCGVLDSRGRLCELGLKQAFWVPTYTRNLISVKKLAEQGAMVSFGKEANIRTRDGTLLPLVCTSDDLYTLRVLPFVCNLGPRALPVERLPGIAHGCGGRKGWSPWLSSHAAQSRTLVQWHRALGHNNFNDVARLTKLVDVMHIRKDGEAGHCDTCAEEKAKRAPVNKASGIRAKKKLDLVHTDVLGLIHQESYEGFRYAIGFVDSYSRYVVMYPMRTRDEVIEKLELFIADVGSPGTLVSDGAQEYKPRGFNEVCRKNGIRQEYSAPYTPQENGKIERMWGTVTGMTRCMLETAGLPKQLWPYALATYFCVKNRCFHSAHNSTPYEMFFGERPNLSEMQPFGCRAFVLTEDRRKLDSKAQTGIFPGYSSRSKCFIVCTEDGTPERKPSKMWTSRNVTFNMDCFP